MDPGPTVTMRRMSSRMTRASVGVGTGSGWMRAVGAAVGVIEGVGGVGLNDHVASPDAQTDTSGLGLA